MKLIIVNFWLKILEALLNFFVECQKFFLFCKRYWPAMLRLCLGSFAYRNYKAQYSLAYADPQKITRCLCWFPESQLKFTSSEAELPREKMKNTMGNYIFSTRNLESKLIDLIEVINFKRFLTSLETGIPSELTGETYWYLENSRNGYVFDGVDCYDSFASRRKSLSDLELFLRENRTLLTRKQLDRWNYREMGGINVAELQSGELVWTGGGLHRLAMAKFYNICPIPVCIVYRDEHLLEPRRHTFLMRAVFKLFGSNLDLKL